MSQAPRAAVVLPDAATLATATAARLLLRLVDLQSVRRPAHVVLTGGTVGIRTLAEVARSPLRDAVDWTGVHVWWGDERFLPDGHEDRNETQAREALLQHLPIPPGNVHPMPPEGSAATPEEAARAYADELAAHAEDGAALPHLDVVLLGMGPDGHVASLFPGHPTLEVTDRTTVGEEDSPKPPPRRVSLTFPTLCSADQVWLVVAGEDKAPAVARVLAGDRDTPATRAVGREATLLLLDPGAAG